MLSHSLGAIILRHVLYWLQEFFRSKPQIPRGAFSEKHPLWTASFSPRPLPTYTPVCPSWLPEGHETECLCDIAQYVFESKKTLSIIKLIFLAFGGNSLFFLSDMEIGTKAPALVTELPQESQITSLTFFSSTKYLLMIQNWYAVIEFFALFYKGLKFQFFYSHFFLCSSQAWPPYHTILNYITQSVLCLVTMVISSAQILTQEC